MDCNRARKEGERERKRQHKAFNNIWSVNRIEKKHTKKKKKENDTTAESSIPVHIVTIRVKARAAIEMKNI